jgi:hypothetical protein
MKRTLLPLSLLTLAIVITAATLPSAPTLTSVGQGSQTNTLETARSKPSSTDAAITEAATKTVVREAGKDNIPMASSNLENILRYPANIPSVFLLTNLTQQDTAALLSAYDHSTNLILKRASTIALAYIGRDEEITKRFITTLTQDYHGIKLSCSDPQDEEYILFETVEGLGLLAAHSDTAYEFLKKGTDQWFWKRTVSWTSDRGQDTVGRLVSSSIRAVATSNRSDAREFIEKLKFQDLVNRTGDNMRSSWRWHSDVVQAAFYTDLIEKEGYIAFKSDLFSSSDFRRKLYDNWEKSADGAKWLEWYRASTTNN